jgi:hypothetical protein
VRADLKLLHHHRISFRIVIVIIRFEAICAGRFHNEIVEIVIAIVVSVGWGFWIMGKLFEVERIFSVALHAIRTHCKLANNTT